MCVIGCVTGRSCLADNCCGIEHFLFNCVSESVQFLSNFGQQLKKLCQVVITMMCSSHTQHWSNVMHTSSSPSLHIYIYIHIDIYTIYTQIVWDV